MMVKEYISKRDSSIEPTKLVVTSVPSQVWKVGSLNTHKIEITMTNNIIKVTNMSPSLRTMSPP